MFNPRDKRKVIDLETKEGIQIFTAAARKQAAFQKGAGLGQMTTGQLLHRVKTMLRHPSYGDGGEIFEYPGCVQDAAIVQNHEVELRNAEKRGNAQKIRVLTDDVMNDPTLKEILLKLDRCNNLYARELLNRMAGRPGEYSDDAAREYWRIRAAEERAGGDSLTAKHFERLSLHPAAGELLAPERTALPLEGKARLTTKPRKGKTPTIKAQDRLKRYDAAIANRGNQTEDEITSDFADAEGCTRKQLVERIRKARIVQATRHAK